MIQRPPNVLILDFRNVVTTGSQEVIRRHEKYAHSLKRITGFNESQITIAGSTRTSLLIPGSFQLQFFSTDTKKWNLLGYSFKVATYIKRMNDYSTILVSGDPWESALAAIMIRIILRRKIPTQIQIHADIGDKVWLNSKGINVFKWLVARKTLKYASSIRTTSLYQQEKILKSFRVNPEILERIPVQLNLPYPDNINSKRKDFPTIGIVGRIHKDRGLGTAVKIIEIIWVKHPEVRLLVAGLGPDLEWLKIELKKINPLGKVQFLGFLEAHELENFWRECGVLLSTAPAESFGRAMREALVRGVPVMATFSAGSLELSSKYKESGLVLISNPEKVETVLCAYDTARNLKVKQSLINKLIEENEVIPDNLAESWIKILN